MSGTARRRWWRSEHGGAMVEFAVVLPVLIIFAIGVMDYGRVVIRSLQVANAARAGAEWGALNASNPQLQSAAQAFAKRDAEDSSTLIVSSRVYCRCGDVEQLNCAGTCVGYGAPRFFVEVTATDTISTLLHYPGLPNKIGVTRKATFRAAQ